MGSDRIDSLRLKRGIEFSEIHWPSVQQTLIRHFKFKDEDLAILERRFREKMTRPFDLTWFINDSLSRNDNAVAAAICESQGADSVTLTCRRGLRLLGLPLHYENIFRFSPVFQRDRSEGQLGTCEPRIDVGIARWRLSLVDARQVIAIGMLLSLFGALFYAITFGLLLYGLSVFALFLVEPLVMTHAATQKPHIGLALLCTLIGMAGAGGKLIKHCLKSIGRLIRSQPVTAASPQMEKRAS